MKSSIKGLCGVLLALGLCHGASASVFQGTEGFFVGIGVAGTGSDDCGADCNASGTMFEAGYDVNRLVGVEFKYFRGSLDDFDDLQRMHYAGVNIGHDFDTHWFRLYGKAGLATITERTPSSAPLAERYTDTQTNPALGIGVRFTPTGIQQGVYVNMEFMGTRFLNDDMGILSLGFGYKF